MEEKELDRTPSKTKDFWLFLIFIDIVALAFFGFLIYQGMSSKFFKEPKTGAAPAEQTEVQPAPVAAAPALPVIKETPKPQISEPVKQEPVKPAPAVKPEEKKEAAKPAEEPKKQSVIIAPNSSKTRKVTFKYWGDAQKVQIVSGFTSTKPLDLKKAGDVWQGTFVIYPGEYKYLFVVDGVRTLDPHAVEKDGRSLIKIE